jgi:hypothetical protein
VSPPVAPGAIGREHGRAAADHGLWLFLLNGANPRDLDMNPEIRAVLFGLLIAALACPVILALFYRPRSLLALLHRGRGVDWIGRLDLV